MVKERSKVSSRTNYRVLCENKEKTIDFHVYYIYSTNTVKIVDVEITDKSTKNARLLYIAKPNNNNKKDSK